jgi:hypothetical protein
MKSSFEKQGISVSKLILINEEPSPLVEKSKAHKEPFVTVKAFFSILIPFIGGTFYFGEKIGSIKFDSEKNNLHDSIFILNKKIEIANTRLTNFKDSIQESEIIKEMDKALTHDKNPIPAWESFKKKVRENRRSE